jgi:hypothetical protein
MKKQLAALVALGFVTFVTACGGSSSGGTPAPAGTTPGASTTTAAAGGTEPENAAAARKEITRNWEKFLASGTPPAVAKTLLETGDSLGPALKKAQQEDKATGGKRSATVTKITFTSPTRANVNYDLDAAGRTLQASGVAVYEDGVWKVSANTFCTLVVLGNGSRPVKGCPS